MRTKIIVPVAICGALLSFQNAYAEPQLLGSSSAGNTGGSVWFNCDFAGAAGDGVQLHHRGQSDGAFTQVAMSPLDEVPFYEFTYEASASFGSDPGILEYYFSARQGSFLTIQSPKNANNQFPPASYKYAHFIPDPSGDMEPGSAGNWLDLTDNGMSYSDTRLYCYLENVSGTWPLGQFPTYYAYTFGFLISSGADSSFYALVYANVPLLISTGLYVLDRVDSTYTRLGNISASVTGGALHMACDLSTFTADPEWPGWPPPEGHIEPMGATLTAGLSGQFANDFTYPAVYEPQTQYLNFGLNGPPQIDLLLVETEPNVNLIARARYSDADNNLPITRRFYFDSIPYTMGSSDHVYSDASDFESVIAWPDPGLHSFYFEFCDGADTILSPPNTIQIPGAGCVYLPGDLNGMGGANGIDVVYGVNFLKGGMPPTTDCSPPCLTYTNPNPPYQQLPLADPFYAAMDVNGNCGANGIDITYFVAFLKGSQPLLLYCPDCPPASGGLPSTGLGVLDGKHGTRR